VEQVRRRIQLPRPGTVVWLAGARALPAQAAGQLVELRQPLPLDVQADLLDRAAALRVGPAPEAVPPREVST
jgi:hypothetical protein